MIYTVTLNPALDYDIYTNKIQLGELNDSNKVEFRAGGKGINVSIMLNNINERSIALGYIAGFTGEYILKDLNAQNIMSDFISVKGNTRINIKLKSEEVETEIAGISPEITRENYEELLLKIKRLKTDDILVLSGSIPGCMEKDAYKKMAQSTKAQVVLDTRGDLLIENIWNNLLIKPNIKELEQAFNKKLNTHREVYDACKIFFDKGVKYILVSMGEKGALLVKKGRMFSANVPSGEMINTIGAGDSTVSGFLKGYTENLEDKEILKLAVACGSATAYSYGIGKKDKIYELIKNIECEEEIYED
ncbi:1-phosphofructokinase [Sneathia sp. DSM 16631]|uniref:1-phosphofructokinase n=1 Tax=Sneathia TaxID=168808 RepID=UPI001868AA93|nr:MULTISPECIES: 1-phosphofructokinase [Sneathia]MBE3031036.1 1-phosphofructokinase [Sneathia sp. DSM 16631]